ncbi:hypothetical protein TNCV_2805561 [Trichonephila clavipes]|nr:hypothetical protein TNCV_2805561 [Trichonephila clavipes]
MAPYRSPLTTALWPSSFLRVRTNIPPAHKAHQTVTFSGSIQPAKCASVAKQENRLHESGYNDPISFGPIRRSTLPLLDDRFDEFETKLRINCWQLLNPVTILEVMPTQTSIPGKNTTL